MATGYDDKLGSIKAKYDAAYTTHQRFVMAIADFAMSGERPPDLLQDAEITAAAELAEATAQLRVAMVARVAVEEVIPAVGNLARRRTL